MALARWPIDLAVSKVRGRFERWQAELDVELTLQAVAPGG
jgi:hypothetical protein